MKHWALAGLVVAATAGSTMAAWAQELNIYLPPECELDTQHFLVRNAALYVKAATEARSPEDRTRSIEDANRVLMYALERGEEANPAVWYFLGRNYALEPDLAGADSAFRRTESLAPECADDIDTHRRFIWVPLYNEGIAALQAGDQEAAREALARADLISDKEPFVPYYLASILVGEGELARAVGLFKKTVAMGQMEGDYQEAYLTSLFNAARLHHMMQDWDSAAVWYRQYRRVVPDDPQAIQGLASVLEAGGHSEEALAAYDTVLAYAELMSELDLFQTGVSLFQAERFERAADAFNLGLQKNRYYRDGIFNLTQAYFALANPSGNDSGTEPSAEEMAARTRAADSMLDAAHRLIEVDPHNEGSLRLLAAAYQLTGEQDSTIALLEVIDGLEYEVVVQQFQPSESGAEMRGQIANLAEETIAFPDVVFEFVDRQGNVLATETLAGRNIAANGNAAFRFTPQAAGVAAWRYRISTE